MKHLNNSEKEKSKKNLKKLDIFFIHTIIV